MTGGDGLELAWRAALECGGLGAVALLGRAAARRLVPSLPASERAIAGALVGAGVVAVALQGLGFSGGLTSPAIVLLALLLVAGSWALTRRVEPAPSSPSRILAGAGVLPAAVALGVLVLLTGRALARVPIEWDGLTYHLLFPAQYLQEGRIFFLDAGRPLDQTGFYPQNAELTFAYLMALAKSDLLVGVSMVFWTAMAGVATARLARDLGASPASAATAGALAATTPALLSRAATSYVEPLLLFSVLSAILFARRALLARTDPERLAASLLSGVAAGLAAGTKFTALPLALALAALVAVGLAADRRERARWRPLAVWSVAASLPAAGWFLRNLWAKGNPLYPAPFLGLPYLERIDLRWQGASVWVRRTELAAKELFGDALFALPPNRAPSMTLGSVAPLAFGLAAIALLLAAGRFAALARSRRVTEAIAELAVPISLVALVVTWFATPFWRNIGLFRSLVRVAVPAAAVAFAMSASVVERLRPRAGWVALAGTVAVLLQIAQAGVVDRSAPVFVLLGAAWVLTVGLASGVVRSPRDFAGSRAQAVLRGLGVVGALATLVVAESRREVSREATWLAASPQRLFARAAIEGERLIPGRATVAFVADLNYEFLYLFHGRRLERRLRVEPPSIGADALASAQDEAWLPRLCEQGVDLLVISKWLSGRDDWPPAERRAAAAGWPLAWEDDSIRIRRPPDGCPAPSR